MWRVGMNLGIWNLCEVGGVVVGGVVVGGVVVGGSLGIIF